MQVESGKCDMIDRWDRIGIRKESGAERKGGREEWKGGMERGKKQQRVPLSLPLLLLLLLPPSLQLNACMGENTAFSKTLGSWGNISVWIHVFFSIRARERERDRQNKQAGKRASNTMHNCII